MCSYVTQAVCNYITAHPYLTAAQIGFAVPAFLPGTVAAPVLGALGFKAIGVAAGSAAAAYQSTHGLSWIFSGLQSAGARGYAAPVINGVVTGVGGAAAAVTEWFKWN